jgi:spermidine synthase
MALDDTWFTEPCDECGSAFSLKIKRKLHEEQSPFQKIDIYETEKFGNLMVIDGFVMLSDRDNFVYHEMMSHPALFTHDNPAKVAIVGGGDCGTLREVLRHPEVSEAWQVEIDERVTRVSEQYFPALTEANDDPRAHFHFGDAIEWFKNTEAESIDVIIVDSTDPIGPAAGLFAEPFYRDCLRALRSGGIIVQQSESPLFHMNIIKPMHRSMRSAGFADTSTLHFFQCSYPSGWWTATMARKDKALDTFREQDVNNRTFETRYYNADIHRAAQAAPEFFKRELGDS